MKPVTLLSLQKLLLREHFTPTQIAAWQNGQWNEFTDEQKALVRSCRDTGEILYSTLKAVRNESFKGFV